MHLKKSERVGRRAGGLRGEGGARGGSCHPSELCACDLAVPPQPQGQATCCFSACKENE